MVNYNNSAIYKIESDQGGLIYIGSTTQQLNKRFQKHLSQYKIWKSKKQRYTTSFEVFDKYGIENCQIILLESVNAKNKEELHAREAHYIKTLECVNKNIPNRTKKEWESEKVICECGCEVIRDSLRKHIKLNKHIHRMNINNNEII